MTFQLPPDDERRSRRTFLLIAATCFAFFAVWAWVFYQQKPRVAEGTIDGVTAVPLHTEMRQGGTMSEGYGGGVQKMDELYVWVDVAMKDLTPNVRLEETGQRATLTLPDGEQKFAEAASPHDVAMVRALPKLRQVPGALMPRDLKLKPGDATRGMMLFAFPITQQTWDLRREFSVAVSFQGERDLALKEQHEGH